MSLVQPSENRFNRWPHRLAVVLVCATFPLIWVGGLVTTYDAGMAVPDWPETYGYNMFLYPWTTWWAGPWDLFIEHGHRLLASGVGLLTIIWLISVWFLDNRRWMRLYAAFCLALVISQGILGGLRVVLDANLLARVHGCVGPLFFIACTIGAGMTSRWWSAADPDLIEGANRTKLVHATRLAWMTAALAYLQLVIGAHLRHMSPSWPPRTFQVLVIAHLIIAFALAVHAILLWVRSRHGSVVPEGATFVRQTIGLVVLVLFQIALGTMVWRVKYQWPTWVPQPDWFRNHPVQAEGMLQVLTVTGHVALGSLIFAMSSWIALRGQRQLGWVKPWRRAGSEPVAGKMWGIVA